MIGNWRKAAVAGVLCLGLAGVAGVGVAQDRPGPGGPPGAGQRPDRARMFEAMRARHEKVLHDVLSIKPDQEGAFHAYLASMTPDRPGDGEGRRGARGEHAPGATPTATTPERLDRMASRMAERQARFQKTSAATKTFYAVLTPEQKRAFDALPTMMHGGHHGMHGHGGPA